MNSKTIAPWLIVAQREILVKLKDKAFWIGTLSTLAMLAIGFGVGAIVGSHSQNVTVAVADQASKQLAQQVSSVAAQTTNGYFHIDVVDANSAEDARNMVSEDKANVALQPDSSEGWVTVYKSDTDDSFDDFLTQTLDSQMRQDLIKASGVDFTQFSQAYQVHSQLLEQSSQTPGKMISYFATIAFAVLFMMSSMVYGMQIATSVIEEKQSRIVEILVSAIPVRQLLTGKVIGNTVLAVTQMAILLIAGLIGVSFVDIGISIGALGSAIIWFILFFLVGFLALACVWAAAGALGTRTEDLNQTSQPLSFMIVIAYICAIAASGSVKVVLSYIPIISSILMPGRVIAGEAQWWEPIISIVISLAFSLFTIRAGARIYRNALLQTSGRIPFKEAFKLARQS